MASVFEAQFGNDARAQGGLYRINRNVSRLTVRAFAGGLLSAFGHSPNLDAGKFNGEVELHDLTRPEVGSVRLVVKADSLTVADHLSEQDRREIEEETRAQVLEAARYPEIVYQSSAI